MTLTQFLDAAYALLVDEYRRLGSSLTEALGRTREYAQGGHRAVTAEGNEEQPSLQAAQSNLTPEELQNEAAMAAFKDLMGEVNFG